MHKKRILLALVAFAACLPLMADRKARLTEAATSMLTYGFSDPDPVANPGLKHYPYFRFDGYESVGRQKEWKTVVLENEWIQVTLFPEIGGKVWGAVDKTNGKEFIYYNHVVKFRDIAMRGAWTSGGIEFNFGIIGHVPSTATPVDYATRENEDGSVSCFIASFELLTRTWWTVEVNVPADKACFMTKTTFINTSPLEQPYYNWMNAAFKASDDLQLCMPGDRYIGHNGDPHPYPVDPEGRDLSRYSQHAFGRDKSLHVIGGYAGFFGAYWHQDGFGYAHYARPDEKLGRKYFCWSQSREGGIWEDLLTDSDGQYVEMQAGRMFNQPRQTQSIDTPFKHHSFAPLGEDRWTEYWYPVEQTGAFQAASPFGAMSVCRESEHGLVIRVSPVCAGTKTVRVIRGGQEVYAKAVSFRPLEPWSETLSGAGEGFLKVVVGENDLVYDEDQASWATGRPDTMPEDFDWRSAQGHCLRGEQLMHINYFCEACAEFAASLAQDPWYAPALRGMASYCLHCGAYETAFDYAGKALRINTYDGEANYLYGLAAKETGRKVAAKDAFSIASYTAAFREAAYAELARIALSESDWRLALTYARKCGSVTGKLAEIAALRKLGDTEACRSLLAREYADLPLFPYFNFERSLLSGSPAAFKNTLRCELPQETILETALWYLGSGLYDEASELCTMTDYPSARYLQAFLAERLGDSGRAVTLLAQANAAAPSFVFPFRPEMLKVFDWAAEKAPDWKLDYYRALILWRYGRKDEAKERMEACGQTPDYNPFYLTRAKLRSGEARLADLRKAESLSQDWRTGKALVDCFTADSLWDKACETGEKYFKKYPDKFEFGLAYAKALCGSGQYGKSLKVLSGLRVMPKEGAKKGHEIYREACLGKAKEELRAGRFKACIQSVEASKIWDERLGVGKPYDELIDYTLEEQIIQAAKDKNRNAF